MKEKEKIKDDTFISVFIDVSEWKKQRLKLLKSVVEDTTANSEWKSAFNLLYTRIETRFLNPIDWILEKQHNAGEGFSIVALQCILIEFLEAFYQGKIFTASSEPKEFEYNSSKKLFRDFLMKREPFSKYFTSNASADGFYDNIRCGLIHEAATKKTSRINNAPTHKMLVKFEENDPSNMRIYRENFYKAIRDYIETYKSKLLSEKELKINFIRKFDNICGIKHNYYFAYGSNMDPERLIKRIKKYHKAFLVTLSDYKFIYNKKSIDGTAKANIMPNEGTVVHGVCFEIDDDDFSVLQRNEGGYNRENILVTINENRKNTKAVTYISYQIDDKLIPSDEYKDLILKAASHWSLEKPYVTEYLDKQA